jgi:hypothetical protein
MTTVHICPISIEMPNAQRCSQYLELSEDIVLMCAQHVGQDHSSSMVNGMPEPPLLRFLPHKTPYLIDFGFFHVRDLNHDLSRIDVLDDRVIDGLELMLFFLMLQ